MPQSHRAHPPRLTQPSLIRRERARAPQGNGPHFGGSVGGANLNFFWSAGQILTTDQRESANHFVMTQTEVIHAYRHLWRAGLRAVCYSYPARTHLRNLLRRAFRAKDAQRDERAIKRTIWFLKNAAREVGIEHKIVKNILMVHYWKDFVAHQERPSWQQIVSGSIPKKSYVPPPHPFSGCLLMHGCGRDTDGGSGLWSRTQRISTMRRLSIC